MTFPNAVDPNEVVRMAQIVEDQYAVFDDIRKPGRGGSSVISFIADAPRMDEAGQHAETENAAYDQVQDFIMYTYDSAREIFTIQIAYGEVVDTVGGEPVVVFGDLQEVPELGIDSISGNEFDLNGDGVRDTTGGYVYNVADRDGNVEAVLDRPANFTMCQLTDFEPMEEAAQMLVDDINRDGIRDTWNFSNFYDLGMVNGETLKHMKLD